MVKGRGVGQRRRSTRTTAAAADDTLQIHQDDGIVAASDGAAAASNKQRGSVLGDASNRNRRLTRSQVAAAAGAVAAKTSSTTATTSTTTTSTDDDDDDDSAPPKQQRRRSARLSKEHETAAAAEAAGGRKASNDANNNNNNNTKKKRGRSQSSIQPTITNNNNNNNNNKRQKDKKQQQATKAAAATTKTTATTRGRSRSARPRRASTSTTTRNSSKAPPATTSTTTRTRSSRTTTTTATATAARRVSRSNRKSSLSPPLEQQQQQQDVDETTTTTNHDPNNYDLVVVDFDPTKFTNGISNLDVRNKGNVLQSPEYVTDIFQRLWHAEAEYRVEPYMHTQKTINVAMRAILVDWLVEVHRKFRLLPESLHLGVSVMDRYLSRAQVSRRKLQLVGITALLIACKYEEIYPPEIRDCVYMTDRAYTRQNVIDMEACILQELQFMISEPTAYPFLHRFLYITGASTTMKFGATYYLERVLQEHDFLAYRPSLVAAAAVCLALNHEGIREYDAVENPLPHIHEAILQYTDFTAQEIYDVAAAIANKVDEESVTEKSKKLLGAVKHKYNASKYEYISDFAAPTVENIILPS